MGQIYSEPVKMKPTLGYVGIKLREPNTICLLHAPREVIAATESVIKKSLEKQVNQQDLLKNLMCMVVGATVLAHIIAFNWNQTKLQQSVENSSQS